MLGGGQVLVPRGGDSDLSSSSSRITDMLFGTGFVDTGE